MRLLDLGLDYSNELSVPIGFHHELERLTRMMVN